MNHRYTQIKPWVLKTDREKVKSLVEDGEFISESEFVRKAIRRLLKEYYSKEEPIIFKVKKDA